ncbi:MAG TPA: hypothetical protein VMV83_16305 [Rectinemataceae bacterium]|nr:hypothetical protein [Rectinemataceae bacterium]
MDNHFDQVYQSLASSYGNQHGESPVPPILRLLPSGKFFDSLAGTHMSLAQFNAFAAPWYAKGLPIVIVAGAIA